MNETINDYRRDLEIVTSIIRTAVLDRDTPLTVGHGDLPSTLRPPAIYVLAMHENPKVGISRQMRRACDYTVFGHALSTIGGVNLNRASRTAVCGPISEGFKTSR